VRSIGEKKKNVRCSNRRVNIYVSKKRGEELKRRKGGNRTRRRGGGEGRRRGWKEGDHNQRNGKYKGGGGGGTYIWGAGGGGTSYFDIAIR